MKKTSLTRALFVAGVMAVAGGVAQADAIFFPNGTHVELGENGVENGLADQVLAQGSMSDTTILGAGPSRMTTTTVTTTTPVYVFPNINFDRSTVLASPHPMMSSVRSLDMDRTAAATFDSPTRAGEASTMTSGAPNLVTTNESVASVPPMLVDTTTLGAGPAVVTTSPWYGTTTYGPVNLSGSNMVGPNDCGINTTCSYLPD